VAIISRQHLRAGRRLTLVEAEEPVTDGRDLPAVIQRWDQTIEHDVTPAAPAAATPVIGQPGFTG
jgi:hypothetical protein